MAGWVGFDTPGVIYYMVPVNVINRTWFIMNPYSFIVSVVRMSGGIIGYWILVGK